MDPIRKADMDAMYDESALEQLASEVFTLPSMLLDQSAAVAAAERMYATHKAGVRFYSDFRRVITVAEMMALSQSTLEDAAETVGEEMSDDEEVSTA